MPVDIATPPSRDPVERLKYLRALARQLGGRCLARTYTRMTEPLEFMCHKRHRWHMKPANVFHGSWCPTCRAVGETRRFVPRTTVPMPPLGDLAAALRALHAVAQQRGGWCRTREADQLRDGVELECANGHRWHTTVALPLRNGTWCSLCAASDPEMYASLQELAVSRGGRLLSSDYRGASIPLEFSCAHGHRWWAMPSNVRKGTWCPVCGREQRANTRRTAPAEHLRVLQILAAEKGGRCLSTACTGPATQIQLACSAGHRWSAPMRQVFRGAWCPRCPPGKEDRLAALASLARARGGDLLTRSYPHGDRRIDLRCDKGHTWETGVQTFVSGAWCPRCSGLVITIEDMQELAAMFGGLCLSKRYAGSTKPLRWACGAGHQFRAIHKQIRNGQWCRICDWMEGTLGRALTAANERGGLLMSKPGPFQRTPLRWRCSEGHTWLAFAARIAAGHWCPKCAGNHLTIEDMRRIASERGGRCLSPSYTNLATKLLWECQYGHQWWTLARNVRTTGRWCPTCGRQIAAKALREAVQARQRAL